MLSGIGLWNLENWDDFYKKLIFSGCYHSLLSENHVVWLTSEIYIHSPLKSGCL